MKTKNLNGMGVERCCATPDINIVEDCNSKRIECFTCGRKMEFMASIPEHDAIGIWNERVSNG